MEENSSRKVFLSVLGVAILIVAVVGISYAAFTFTNGGQEDNTITTGTITTTYTEAAEGLSLTNALPVPTATAKESDEYFAFNVTTNAAANSGVVINYTITATPQNVGNNLTMLPTDQVRVYLEAGETNDGLMERDVLEPTLLSAMTPIAVGNPRAGSYTLAANERHSYTEDGRTSHTTYYRFRMWVDEAAPSRYWNEDGMQYKLKINVDATALPLS